MSVELIKNIKSLTRIQLLQNKHILICIISALGVFIPLSNLGMILNHNDETSTLVISTNFVPIIFFLILLAIIPRSTNILTNKKISMYPGTGISRFVSRILADHISIMIILGFTFFMYCIGYPVLMAIRAGGADISVAFAFDIKYALVGTINVLSYFMLAYGVSVLLYSVATKLGGIKTIILYTVIFMIAVVLLKSNIISYIGVRDYFGEERNFYIFVFKTWSIWFITMILSLLVASSTKIIKDDVRGIKSIVYIAIIGFFIFTSFVPTSSIGTSINYGDISSYSAASKFEELKETNIYKETLVKCDELNRAKVVDLISRRSPKIYFMKETEAIKGGILDNASSMRGEILVITFFPDEKFNDQYMYKYYLDNMTISCKNSVLNYSFPKTKTFLNLLWGNSYKFLESYDLENIGHYPDIYLKSVLIIAPESVMIN